MYRKVLEYMWFMQAYGDNSHCRFQYWNESKCFLPHTRHVEYCGFTDWNATFCFEAYNISMQKLQFVEEAINDFTLSDRKGLCTLMVVLLPLVSDIMWLYVPCNKPILDIATL